MLPPRLYQVHPARRSGAPSGRGLLRADATCWVTDLARPLTACAPGLDRLALAPDPAHCRLALSRSRPAIRRSSTHRRHGSPGVPPAPGHGRARHLLVGDRPGAPGRVRAAQPGARSRSARNRDRSLMDGVSREPEFGRHSRRPGGPEWSGGPIAHASTILARTAKGSCTSRIIRPTRPVGRARFYRQHGTGGDVRRIDRAPAYRARTKL